MMWTILALLLLLGGAALLLVGYKVFRPDADTSGYHRDEIRNASFYSKFTGLVLAFLGAGILFMSSFVIIPANNVGVITTFGRWDGTAQSGWTWVKPWSKVDTFPTRNQKSVRDQAEGNDSCVSVKLKGGSSACVDMTVLYTINESKAETLWRGWGSFDKLNVDLINRSTDDASGVAYGAYAAEDASNGENRSKLTSAVSEELRKRLEPHGVELNAVTLGDIHLPQDVQDRINGVLAQDAQNRISLGKLEQAKIDAETQRVQRDNGMDPMKLRCLEVAREVKPQVMPGCGVGEANTPGVVVGVK